MRKSLELLLSKKLNNAQLVTNIFSNFKDIKITDSSVIFLRDSLNSVFPGAGGKKGSSGVKVQLIYSYLTSIITGIDITKGNVPDQKYSIELLKLIKKGELFIADLGYMVLNLLYKIDSKEAYFLGRFQSNRVLYEKIIINTKPNKTAIYKIFKIEDHPEMFQADVTEKILYLKYKKEYLEVRVILFKNPEDTVNNRRRLLNKNAKNKNKSKKPTDKSLILCNWSIFMTNTGEDKLPYRMIHNIYRIRWNVELIFKSWKSILDIHKSNVNKNEYRVKMELYAKLILAVVIQKIYQIIAPDLWKNKKELSLYKMTDLFFRNIPLIAHAILKSTKAFAQKIEILTKKAMKTCLKTHQKSRKTSLQMIDESIEEYLYEQSILS